jgi:hypothetical protein
MVKRVSDCRVGRAVAQVVYARPAGYEFIPPWSPEGSIALSLCAAAHPLHTGCTNIFGTFVYDTAVRPNLRRLPFPDAFSVGALHRRLPAASRL